MRLEMRLDCTVGQENQLTRVPRPFRYTLAGRTGTAEVADYVPRAGH
jgi:hypothetical protein